MASSQKPPLAGQRPAIPNPPGIGYDAACECGTVPIHVCRKGPPPGVDCLTNAPSGLISRGSSSDYGADMCCEKGCASKEYWNRLPSVVSEAKESMKFAPVGEQCMPTAVGWGVKRGVSGEYGADMCLERGGSMTLLATKAQDGVRGSQDEVSNSQKDDNLRQQDSKKSTGNEDNQMEGYSAPQNEQSSVAKEVRHAEGVRCAVGIDKDGHLLFKDCCGFSAGARG